jgi:hypothetical protein
MNVLLESYTDYPQSATNNAKRALEWVEKHGWGTCGEATGKKRANQLANREPISRDTIARMASFKRHQQHKDVPYSEGCGGLMWDAWGGTSGIEWAINKLNKIEMKEQINSILHKVGLKAVEVKLEQIMTADGQAALEAEIFEAGQPVFIVNEDERIPLPVGEYAMADDMILKVAEEGIIASYEKKEMEAEEPITEEPVAEVEVEASNEEPGAEEEAPSKISEEDKAEIIGEIKKLILEEIPSILEDMKKDEEKEAEMEEEVKEETELSKPIQHNPENVQPREQISFNKKEVSLRSKVYDLISK